MFKFGEYAGKMLRIDLSKHKISFRELDSELIAIYIEISLTKSRAAGLKISTYSAFLILLGV